MPRWHRLVTPYAERFPATALRAGKLFTIMEIAVLQPWRRHGVGRALHDALLDGRYEHAAMLTVRPDAADAVAAYRAWGWRRAGHRARTDGPGYDILVRELMRR